MDLESIMLSEINQREKDKYYMISLTWGILKKYQKASEYNKNRQAHRYRKQTSGYQWGEGSRVRHKRGGRLRGTNY